MEFFALWKAFHKKKKIDKLSTAQFALWEELAFINNNLFWLEKFPVTNKELVESTKISRTGILKARKVLAEKGYILFETNGTNATIYSMIDLTTIEDSVQVVQDSVQVIEDSAQVVNKDTIEDSAQVVQDSVQVIEDSAQVVQDSATIIDYTYKTKHNIQVTDKEDFFERLTKKQKKSLLLKVDENQLIEYIKKAEAYENKKGEKYTRFSQALHNYINKDVKNGRIKINQTVSGKAEEAFEKLYEAYPSNKKKYWFEAREAFLKSDIDINNIDFYIKAIDNIRNEGKFIPELQNWILKSRWKGSSGPTEKESITNEYQNDLDFLLN